MGPIILFLLSFVPFAYGLFAVKHAQTVFQDIEGLLAILIGAVFFSSAFVASSIDQNRRKTTQAIKDLNKRISSMGSWPGVKDD